MLFLMHNLLNSAATRQKSFQRASSKCTALRHGRSCRRAPDALTSHIWTGRYATCIQLASPRGHDHAGRPKGRIELLRTRIIFLQRWHCSCLMQVVELDCTWLTIAVVYLGSLVSASLDSLTHRESILLRELSSHHWPFSLLVRVDQVLPQ